MRRQLTHYRQPDPVWDFMSEMQRAMDDFWTSAPSPSRTPQTTFTPAVDLHETSDFYLVSLDAPGVKPADVKINVEEGRLTISGERSREEHSDTSLFKRFERSYGSFERTFQLPKNVDEGKIQARFENGVLEVLIPKAELSKPRSIEISTEKGGLFSKLLGKTEKADNH